MNQSLPADIAARIQAQLATGDFTSEEQVLREALDTLEKRQKGLTRLRDLVDVAEADVEAGRVGPFDIDQTMVRIEERRKNRDAG